MKAAWEIALDKNEEYERLAVVTDELLNHVAMLEESWNAIQPREAVPAEAERPAHRIAA
ncbi:MAG: hypothetical protein WAM30_19025 [Candidatus Dormiibacterota bacterium]